MYGSMLSIYTHKNNVTMKYGAEIALKRPASPIIFHVKMVPSSISKDASSTMETVNFFNEDRHCCIKSVQGVFKQWVESFHNHGGGVWGCNF